MKRYLIINLDNVDTTWTMWTQPGQCGHNLDNDLSTWTAFWTTWTMICPLGQHSGQSGHHSGQRHLLVFLMKPNIFL